MIVGVTVGENSERETGAVVIKDLLRADFWQDFPHIFQRPSRPGAMHVVGL